MSNLSNLLAWSIENSDPTAAPTERKTELNPALVAELMGMHQKSDAELMKEAMAAILDPEVDLDNKEIAFDNFELMIEQLDNANNIENLALWPPLISLLDSPERKLRFMAAWCCGTAVQNNVKSQEAFQSHGGVQKLVDIVLKDPAEEVRKKGCYALSSAIRNMQKSLNLALGLLPEEVVDVCGRQLDADDMDGIDKLMKNLRERSAEFISQ